jgi:hypothetical protein
MAPQHVADGYDDGDHDYDDGGHSSCLNFPECFAHYFGLAANPSVAVDTEMLPTVLVYRAGQLEHTFIRVDWEAGEGGIQNLLIKYVARHSVYKCLTFHFRHGILPPMSFSNPGDSFGLGDSDEEYDLDD